MIPRLAHFVFGLKDEPEPFHFAHYVSIESCRRVLEPERILFHHHHLPDGPWWELIRPHLQLVRVDPVDEVAGADYSRGDVPNAYRYAHHADFIRLDALLRDGGVYADIDTIFVRRFPDELFAAPFVIGREPPVWDAGNARLHPSLCNALLMSEPGSRFARAWRERMATALDGSWSNHSGCLSQQLSELMPDAVRVEPEPSFFSYPATPAGLSRLLAERDRLPDGALSIHLWAHLWWDRERRDFSDAHAGWCTPRFIRHARTTFAELARPYLPRRGRRRGMAAQGAWIYLSLDESSGYGVAADRCMSALEQSGLEIEWQPLVAGSGWGLGYQPAPVLGQASCPVAIAHLVPEYLPRVRERFPEAFLVSQTVWETDRIPRHWVPSLDLADLIIVPSRLSADAIAASAVQTPVAVVPYVASAVTGRPTPPWTEFDDDVVVFYTIAEWTERKAVFKTVEAYLRAFRRRDRVLLIVKTSREDRTLADRSVGRRAGKGTTAWSLARLIAAHPDPPAIRLITHPLAPAEIAGLHDRGDCYVSLCRGEGWGMGAFDAAASGNPVVTTGFGGHRDFLAGSPYLVDFELVPVDDPGGRPAYAPDQRWADADTEHGARLLREIAAAPVQARAVVAGLAADIRERYRPATIASQLRSAVAQHRRDRDDRRAVSPVG